jgi:hypothetical protein
MFRANKAGVNCAALGLIDTRQIQPIASLQKAIDVAPA